MKRKLLLSATVIPAALLAAGAMGQVVNFHDADNGQLTFPAFGVGYDELFAGQGAYSDPGNDIWNGFGQYAGYQSTYFYSGDPGSGGPWPQPAGNPGNPYSSFNSGGGFVTSDGPNLFTFSTGSTANTGNATSSGQFTHVTLSISGYPGDNGIGNIGANAVPNGSPSFLLGEAAVANGTNATEIFTLHNVPAGTYGLYLYAADENNNRGTAFAVNSGTAHNGLSATLNSQAGEPAQAFSEGQNFVIFQNVTPDGSGNITITATPNSQDGVGNSNDAGETDVNGFQLIFNPPPTAVGSTAAQNVYVGSTASFSFSPAFATSPTFQWQFIVGNFTNNLTDGPNVAGSGTTNLVLSNVSAPNVGLYQCVIKTATATNTSPAAPLTLLTSTATAPLQNGDPISVSGYILRPGDALSDFNNNFAPPYNSIPPAFDMSVTNVEDGTLDQYVNFGGDGSTAPFIGPVGFAVTPLFGPTVATGIRFYASSSHPEDDPADYQLSGSTDGGATYTPIAGGLLSIPAQRNAAGGFINVTNQVLQEVDFVNTNAYTTYQLTFTNVKNDATASNGVQIAEVQLLGSLPAGPPGIVAGPNPANVQLVGTTLSTSIAGNGPGPFTYQWSFNSKAIANATDSAFILPNLQTTNAGTYSVVLNSPYGTTNASLALTIVAPTPYQKTLLGYNPLGYWPLDESGGPTAYDEANGYNGTYTGSGLAFQQPGVPFAGFGSPSYSVEFPSGCYVNIPEGPFNITTPITIAAWIQINSTPGSFEDIIGHGDTSYRITDNGTSDQAGFNDGNDSNSDATDANPLGVAQWHFVVGVYAGGSGSTPNGFLYVDGEEVASNEIAAVAGNSLNLWIGGAPDYGTARTFTGEICQATVIPQALTASQVLALYVGAAPAPSVTATNTATVDEGGSVTIPSAVLGAPPISYQWYYLNQVSSPVIIPGATNSSLTLTNVQLVQEDYGYYVVVSNSFGSATSAPPAYLNVVSGAPTIVSQPVPALASVPVGIPVTFSVSATGTEPFSYQWSNSVAAIAGATNSSFTVTVLPGTNTYSVLVGNVDGSTPSSTVTLVGLTNPPPVLSFAGGGNDWTTNGPSGGFVAAFSNSDVLTLTQNAGGQDTSAFYNFPQYIGGFVASFTYQESNSSPADGIAFALQNSVQGTNALGGGGGDLGFAGITNSAALEFNVYSGDHGGAGIALGTNGEVPDTAASLGNFISTAPVNLSSGDPINVLLSYSQNILNVWLTDAKTSNTYHTTFSVNLTQAIGSSVAYVGFTGATGGLEAQQTVSNFQFSYSEPAMLTIQRGASGTIILSWPIAVSTTLVLQQSSNLNGPWTDVSGTPQNVNYQNQLTLTAGAQAMFYRLALQ